MLFSFDLVMIYPVYCRPGSCHEITENVYAVLKCSYVS